MPCTIYVAKTKALISFAVTTKLICVFVFTYAKSQFSHDEAHNIKEVNSKGQIRLETDRLLRPFCCWNIMHNSFSHDRLMKDSKPSVIYFHVFTWEASHLYVNFNFISL